MICPKIRKTCLKEKCMFWMGLKNDTTQDIDYDCIYRWKILLQLEGKKET